MRPGLAYEKALEEEGFYADEGQAQVVRALDGIYDRLLQRYQRSPLQTLKRLFFPCQQKPTQGLYLWGDVGTGKTHLMDLFFSCLPFAEKKRVHFHQFMRDIHQQLTQRQGQQDPLDAIAVALAKDCYVLCFDEFYVSDIGDAMLLAGLLKALFERGVCLLATSNVEPKKLYEYGLQRARFLPAIDLIELHTAVLKIPVTRDYRLRLLEQMDLYYYPLNDNATTHLKKAFEKLAVGDSEENTRITIENRLIDVVKVAPEVVWFDFMAICHIPRSQMDYLEIARSFHTVLVSGVPIIHELPVEEGMQRNLIRAWINVVDILYDAHVTLIVTAEAAIPDIYRGGALAFEYQRTCSRLLEMQSKDYLHAPHQPPKE